ncbi:MAG TPA: ABC transporter substrate-binding protein [Nitrososphaeraceae archaeon]|jgi:NitT/TauT family transport system substrate-binding protein
MNYKNKLLFAIASIVLTAAVLFLGPSISNDAYSQGTEKKVLRLGYFSNINHAQAVIGLGNGDYQKALGENIEVKPHVFNAGPSAIEALFANQIDASYIGPNPAINGYVVSGGKDLRIVSGATSGGAVFVVRNDSGIQSTKDFANKKFASPQLGNTQDVALRKYLLDNGYKTTEKGGNVQVSPVTNADILTLLLKKDIDGAWVPEPWGERFIKEANSRLFVDERDLWPDGKFVTAHIIVRTDYLKNNPDVIKKLLAAHINETQWINSHKEDALKQYNTELKRLTGQSIPEDILAKALTRLELTWDPIKSSLFKSANDAFDIGFLGKTRPDLSGIYDLTLLNEVLKEKGLKPVGEETTTIQSNATTTTSPNSTGNIKTNASLTSGNLTATIALTNTTNNATSTPPTGITDKRNGTENTLQ